MPLGRWVDDQPPQSLKGIWPPSATLHITLELVSWKTVTEVTNDKKVIKKIVNEREGYERPNEGTVTKGVLSGMGCVVVCIIMLSHLSDSETYWEVARWNYRRGMTMMSYLSSRWMKSLHFAEQVVDGLDIAVMTMKKGVVAKLTIALEYGFGSSESKQELVVVPPNSTLYYEVELESFVKVSSVRFLFVRLLHYAWYDEEEKKQPKVLKVSCNMNNATCKLKLKEYKHAEKLCTKVLELESTNVKALYRRAQDYIQLAYLDLAEIDIKKALEIDPNNRGGIFVETRT
ncbi:hypothetical protein IFM89_029939 [Coptis chinensis]|uniref:peptidylprolyl isomerase n=1 Tax=Coptis chinensis TaxID=261450 RepID=A0A835LPB7_9MAGN|nr:hypothetical protein IFM89_029939 [Coptis chinensis]